MPNKADLAVAEQERIRELEFRKTNEAIGLRVSSGRLSFLSRKLFNVLVYHAQQLREPGKNAPIATAAAQKYFWIPMSQVAHDAEFNSKDMQLLKDAAKELQNIGIVVEDETQWTAERLLAGVKIVNSAGAGKRGGCVWFGFTFPPEVAQLVLSPQHYTRLSIYYQAMLRSGASLALYEVCRRYATNPSKLTAREAWQWWFSVLSSTGIREVPPQYKYFKRDVLKPAIGEVNAVTDIEIEMIEFTHGRRVGELQFKVELRKQRALDLASAPIAQAGLIERLKRLGFKDDEATTLSVSYDPSFIRATLEMIEARIRNRASAPIENKVAYFRSALAGGYAKAKVNSDTRGLTERAKKQLPVRSERDREESARRDQALRYFDSLLEHEKAALLSEFKQSIDNKLLLPVLERHGLTHPMTRTAFAEWLAKQTSEMVTKISTTAPA